MMHINELKFVECNYFQLRIYLYLIFQQACFYYLLSLSYIDCSHPPPPPPPKYSLVLFLRSTFYTWQKGKSLQKMLGLNRIPELHRRHWFYYVRGISLPETKEKVIYTFCTRCHIYYHYVSFKLDSATVSRSKSSNRDTAFVQKSSRSTDSQTLLYMDSGLCQDDPQSGILLFVAIASIRFSLSQHPHQSAATGMIC